MHDVRKEEQESISMDDPRGDGIRRQRAVPAIVSAVMVAGVVAGGAWSFIRADFRVSSAAGSAAAAQAMATGPAGASSNAFRDPAGDYVLTMPSGWYAETRPSGSVAFYPVFDTSFPTSSYDATRHAPALCKIELSLFPSVPFAHREAWITATVGADPTLTVRTHAQRMRSVGGMPAVQWEGTIDGASTTLIYIFLPSRTYELVPIASEDGGHCVTALASLMADMTFPDQ